LLDSRPLYHLPPLLDLGADCLVEFLGRIADRLETHRGKLLAHLGHLDGLREIGIQPGKLDYASGGIGSAQHLAAELFNLMAGIKMVHVPFKGAVSIPDVIAGRVQMVFSGVPQALAHVQAGRLRAIGVTTPRRSPAVPDVPTLSEAGVTGYDVTVWYGIFATGGTPRTIVSRLNADFVKAINTPEVRQQLTAMGLEPVGNSCEEFKKTVRSEIKQWGQVINRTGIKQQ